jgi:hypothetical protein
VLGRRHGESVFRDQVRDRCRVNRVSGGTDPDQARRRAMNISLVDPITIAFGAFNLLRLASYFPQIAAVARDRQGAPAISFSCWSIWIGANATTALYAWVNLGDLTLAAISAFNAACCTVVLVLAAYKRAAARLQ